MAGITVKFNRLKCSLDDIRLRPLFTQAKENPLKIAALFRRTGLSLNVCSISSSAGLDAVAR